MDVLDPSSHSRMKRLITLYVSILCVNGLRWIVQDQQELAVKTFLSAMKPRILQQLLETDLELAHYSLEKEVKGFIKHAMASANAFQLTDSSRPTKSK